MFKKLDLNGILIAMAAFELNAAFFVMLQID